MRIAELIARSLASFGVDRIFHVPGESFLALLDALHDCPAIDLITCRHEGSAGLAAVADAKLTGRPGVAAVSRGPGLFNAAIALHVAEQEAIPLVLLVGQVDTPNLDRGAVQEVSTLSNLSKIIKGAYRLDKPEAAAEVLRRALTLACSGTPGPVVIELPEDCLAQPAAQAAPTPCHLTPPVPAEPVAGRFAQVLDASRRPIMIVGGQNRTPEFRDALQRFSVQYGLPVIAASKQQDQFPNDHENWAGQLGFFASQEHIRLLEQADLIVAVGTRLGDLSTVGFRYPRQGTDRQKLVHVYPDPDVIGSRFQTDLGIPCDALAFIAPLLETPFRRNQATEWAHAIEHTREALHRWHGTAATAADTLGHVVYACSRKLSPDGVITTDSGNFAAWVHRIFTLHPRNRLLGSACGAMGSGVPAALAASLRYPGRQVTAFCGDGGFLMNGSELITAVARGLDLKIVISNNGSYGTIRSHQQRTYPGRVVGTDLANPDFSLLAAAFGAKGIRVNHASQAIEKIDEAYAHCGPVLVEVICDPDHTVSDSL